jgi:ABC-type branched-subunit amino acid transport system ATPase component
MGKSTLLKTLIGLLPMTCGGLFFRGEDLSKLPVHQRSRRGISYVPQGRQLFTNLSVRQNIELGAAPNEREVMLGELVTRFQELATLLDRPAGQLSGGEQQLVAIARALASRPKLLLLDEPTEGIQPSIVSELARLIPALALEQDMSVLVAEQNVAFLKAISAEISVMSKGEVGAPKRTIDLEETDFDALLTN